MKSRPHGDHLIQLTRQGWMNAYLVREDDGLTLVDTTISGGVKPIITAAVDAGAPIVRIALTHSHYDHCGSVDELHDVVPKAELCYPEREIPFLRGDRSLREGEPQSKVRGKFKDVAAQASRALQPGDRVGSLEVVASPGHTPGHVAYRDVRDGSLICGDAYQTLGGISVAGVLRPLFPLPAMACWDKPTARRSAQALRELEPSRLAPGHGRVLENPTDPMDEAIAAAV